jgi:hypothetical protein
MNTSANPGARVIYAYAALYNAWQQIREAHPDVPDAVIITGSGKPKGRGAFRRGHHWPERWGTVDTGEKRLPEIFVAGELFDPNEGDAGVRVMQTLLHEAAHGMASTRMQKDTSRGGRYHNKRFVELARELGLTTPGEPHPSIGWSDCHLDDDGQGRWADAIRAVDTSVYLRGAKAATVEAVPKATRSGARVSVQCACDRKLSITPKQLEQGALICGVCREEFHE